MKIVRLGLQCLPQITARVWVSVLGARSLRLSSLIDPTPGELDVRRASAPWRWDHDRVWRVPMYARRFHHGTASPPDAEAAFSF